MLNQEIKGNLAKLLATENLLVEHKNVSTASFNVDDRVLTLPRWDRASNTVYDLLVGHEVGHALYTPVWGNFDCPMDYVNVTEDARVEKLMKRRYPGLRKTFYSGYSELNSQDFFGIADEDIDSLKFIDRVNLWFKIGTAGVLVKFNTEEKVLVDECAAAETFDEAVAIAQKIWEYSKEEQNDLEQLANIPQSGGGSSSSLSETQSIDGEQPDQEEGDMMTHEEMLEEAARREQNNEEGSIPTGGELSDSDTQQSFDKASEKLSNNFSRQSTTYVDIPKFDPSNYVVDWTTIHDWIDECRGDLTDAYWYPDSEYKSFKKSVQKEVNYLVKEFECKKSADAYSRSMTSRTGVLNTNKLHTYKFNDDLFKKITIVPEGKNHGMLFILDWSGSMNGVMLSTIKQLLVLVMFCRKVGIPFEVYAFSTDWITAERSIAGKTEDLSNEEYFRYKNTAIHNEVHVNKSFFRMLNFLSSRSNAKNFDRQCLNLWREVFSWSYHLSYHSTIGLGLSGTPLNESILVMKDIIPEFKKSTGVNKVNLMILTDGDACCSSYGHEVTSLDGKTTRMTVRRIDYSNIILRDRKLGRTYNCDSLNFTNLFIDNLKENNPDVNVMGFRIIESSGLTNFYYRYCENSCESLNEIQKQWKKEKSAVLINPISYDALYAVHAKATNIEDVEFDVDAGASKTKVKSAFRKMLSKKQNNKKILNSFISLIS